MKDREKNEAVDNLLANFRNFWDTQSEQIQSYWIEAEKITQEAEAVMERSNVNTDNYYLAHGVKLTTDAIRNGIETVIKLSNEKFGATPNKIRLRYAVKVYHAYSFLQKSNPSKMRIRRKYEKRILGNLKKALYM